MHALLAENPALEVPQQPTLAFAVRDLSKRWRGRRGAAATVVFDRVSLAAERGTCVALLGENGAGKTTLLKMLAGLALPDAGEVIRHGRVAFCGPADRSFYYRLSARDNLRFFGALYGLPGPTLESTIESAAAAVDLTPHLHKRFSDLSSGLRQRLTLARALLVDADILLLDEPTKAVDPLHAETLRAFVRERLVRELGKTVVLATNLFDEAWYVADRVVVASGGGLREIAWPGSTLAGRTGRARYDVSLRRPSSEFEAALTALAADSRYEARRDGEGVRIILEIPLTEHAIGQIFTLAGRYPNDILSIALAPPRASDVFEAGDGR